MKFSCFTATNPHHELGTKSRAEMNLPAGVNMEQMVSKTRRNPKMLRPVKANFIVAISPMLLSSSSRTVQQHAMCLQVYRSNDNTLQHRLQCWCLAIDRSKSRCADPWITSRCIELHTNNTNLERLVNYQVFSDPLSESIAPLEVQEDIRRSLDINACGLNNHPPKNVRS